MKQIIINADDFGRHVLINRAVEKALHEGMLRSATIMAGGAAFADAAELAVRTPALGVGIHFTLVDGTPVLPPAEIPTLVTAEGKFAPDHTALTVRVLRGMVRMDEVRAELSAQLQRVTAAGIRPTHADSHQHMHVLPRVIDVVLDLCTAAHIPAMRAPYAPLFAGQFGGVAQFVGRAGLAVLAHRAAAKARRHGIAVPDHFAGIVAGEAVDTAALTHIAAHLAGGVTEVMLHPGTDSDILVRACRWQHDFEAELAAACAPEVRTALAAGGAAVVNFQALTQ